jgi:H+/Cl- antiporter ClcA
MPNGGDVSGETTPLVSSASTGERSNETEDQHSSSSRKYLSLDFDRIVNEYSTSAALERNKHIFQERIRSHNGQDSTDDDHQEDDNNFHQSGSTLERAKNVKLSNRGFVVARWYLTMLVGISTGLTAAFVLYFVEKLIEFRVGRLNREIQFLEDPNYDEIKWYDTAARVLGTPGVYLGYMLFNLLLVSISTFLCETLAPGAVSSGIPEVMSYLNGVRVGNFDSLSLYGVKLICTIFSVSSGLVIGPEGPVVHMGSILGACVTRLGDLEWLLLKFRGRYPNLARHCGCEDVKASGSTRRQTWLSKGAFYLSHFRNDLERRNLISVGAAAGFASAFGAPVGGLLYSMEEASSFFDHEMLWKTLVGTCLATSIIAIYHGDFTKYSMLSLEVEAQEENMMARFGEVPLYIVMGILGGILGGTFNNVYWYLNYKRKHFYEHLAGTSKKRRRYVAFKLLESGFVSLLTSAIMPTAPLQASWACKDVSEVLGDQSNEETYVHRYNCPEGYANEMGSILFGSREASIKDILSDPEAFEPNTLLTVGLIFLGLMTITFGTSVPSGMFMPTVLT